MKEIDIVRKLKENGYEAYFVGGRVREMIVERPSVENEITTYSS